MMKPGMFRNAIELFAMCALGTAAWFLLFCLCGLIVHGLVR